MQIAAGQMKRAAQSIFHPGFNLSFALLITLAFVLRLLGLRKSIWLDEASTLQIIFSPDFLQAIHSYDHPPLYLVILKGWSLFGRSEAFLRIPSVLLGIAAVAVIMLLLKRENWQAALLAGALCSLSPVMLRFSQEIRDYALLTFLTALAFYFANQLIHSPHSKPAQIGLVLSLSAAAATHLVGVFLIPAVALYLICHPSARSWQNLALLAIPLLCFFWIYFGLIPPSVRSRAAGQWGEGQLDAALLVFVAAYLGGVFALAAPLPMPTSADLFLPASPLTLILMLCLLIVIAGLLLGNWRRSFPYLLAALTYWGGLIAYSLVSTVVLSERTALPGLIPFTAFAALQFSPPLRGKRWLLQTSALGLVCLGMTANWVTQTAWQPQEDWRSLCLTVSDEWQPGDLVIVFPGYAGAAFPYYAPQIPPEAMLLLPVQPGAPAPIDQLQPRLPAGRVFLVYRPDAQSARDSSTFPALQSILHKKTGPPIQQQFGWLTLEEYDLPDP